MQCFYYYDPRKACHMQIYGVVYNERTTAHTNIHRYEHSRNIHTYKYRNIVYIYIYIYYIFQIIILSIIPRLDIPREMLQLYNRWMKEIAGEHQCIFLDLTCHFPSTHLRLWASRDPIHISSDFGLPMLVTVVAKCLRSIPGEKVR